MHIIVHNFCESQIPHFLSTRTGQQKEIKLPILDIINAVQMLQPSEASVFKDEKTNVNTHINCVAPLEYKVHVLHVPATDNKSMDCAVDHLMTAHFLGQSYKIIHRNNSSDTNICLSLTKSLRYIGRQILPIQQVCRSICSALQTQNSCNLMQGFKFQSNFGKQHSFVGSSDLFTKDNATIISRITDDFKLYNDQNTYKHTSSLLQLASILCAHTPPNDNPLIYMLPHLSKHTPNEETLSVIMKTTPIKQKVTILTKGSDVNNRIGRHNLVLRSFSAESPLTKQLNQETSGLNSNLKSNFFVLQGPYDHQMAVLGVGDKDPDWSIVTSMLGQFYNCE